MRIVIAGGSGLLGRTLTSRLGELGHDVVVLTRDASGTRPGNRLRYVEWDPEGDLDRWTIEVEGAHAVINLAGAGLPDRRWTPDRKVELRSSRVLPTRSLVAAIRRSGARPSVFIQGSAVGFYGATDSDREFDESYPPGGGFLSDLCVRWEAEAHPVSTLGVRLVVLRSGVVLTRDGGAVAHLRLPYRFLVGGPVSPGRQYISWVHHEDWVRMVEWALTTPVVSGVFNNTSPTPVTNVEFSRALGRALHRPSWLPVPRFALRALVGEMANEMLINGQRVVPRRSMEMGFIFEHAAIDEAMERAV
jgi:uncharacterized protein (TIGR01777 family)